VPATISSIDDSSFAPPIRGFLHRPESPNDLDLVLTHSAGGNARSPLLIAVAEAFAAAGFTVLRCELPFRQKRAFGPPRRSAEEDRAGLRNAVALLSRLAPGRCFLGGHSYGGRQASMLAAEDATLAAGLLLLAYPLHPPRNLAQMRTAHFAGLKIPALFVHGSRDSFGSLPELEAAIKLIPAPTRLLPVPGAGHDLHFGRRSPAAEQLPQQIATSFREFFHC
jgi:predicted alpha/beta-hydrolase family hydrolase